MMELMLSMKSDLAQEGQVARGEGVQVAHPSEGFVSGEDEVKDKGRLVRKMVKISLEKKRIRRAKEEKKRRRKDKER
eukprot:UN07590